MKQIFTLIAILTSYCVFAQNAEISGKVIDQNTKEPLHMNIMRLYTHAILLILIKWRH